MNAALRSISTNRKTRLLLTVAIIAIGLVIAIVFSVRSVRSFRQIQYIRQQGLDQGTASVNAIAPWMTLRFIAVAYAVPEEFMYSRLGVPFDQRNANAPLGKLNRDYQLGNNPETNELIIIDKARAAILEYRANPVATGLRDVRPWMSVAYIANGSGVPADYIFQQIGLTREGNEFKPLDLVSDEQHYKGGPRALTDAIQHALDSYSGSS